MKTVVALVCPNGLGHYRRVLGILGELIRRRPGLEVHVACSERQLAKFRDWETSRFVWGAGARPWTGLLEPGVSWSRVPADYDDGRLTAWSERLRALSPLGRADVVLSDNLVGTLEARPDAVLSGSFLWSDVLGSAYPARPAVSRFVDLERRLLEKHRPTMLCVADMAMPGVRARTNAAGLDWMCEGPAPTPRPVGSAAARVALLSGAGGVTDDPQERMARRLLDESDVGLLLPPARARRLASPRVEEFDFSDAAFGRCDLVVCRPGMGTLTACVAHRVPVLAVAEEENQEMMHNARRVKELGIGDFVSARDATQQIALDRVRGLLEPGLRAGLVESLGRLGRNGLAQAAEQLDRRLDGKE